MVVILAFIGIMLIYYGSDLYFYFKGFFENKKIINKNKNRINQESRILLISGESNEIKDFILKNAGNITDKTNEKLLSKLEELQCDKVINNHRKTNV